MGVFPLFLKMVVDIIVPKRSIIFSRLIRPISTSPILSKGYEKLVSHKLSNFCEKFGLLTAAQFAYRKGLGCTDALLTLSQHI